jgi:hypothetical protein
MITMAKKNKERMVKVCPRCGSREFYTVGKNFPRHACKSCAFSGSFLDVPESEARKIKQKPSKYFSPFPAPPSSNSQPGTFWVILTIAAVTFLIYIWARMIFGGF